MYSRIMVPVDLRHTDQMEKALKVAADIAKLYSAELHMVGVGQSVPSQVAHTPAEFEEKLAAFAKAQAASLGVAVTPRAEVSHDPSIDLDNVLKRAAEAIGVDLIVMASHVPGLAEHLFASNAGYLASHSSMSVLVVR